MSHDDDMNALLHPVQRGLVSLPGSGKVLLVNALSVPDLAVLVPPGRVVSWQWWKGAADQLKGYEVSADAPSPASAFAAALVRQPRQREEGLYTLAKAWDSLAEGGLLIVAASNDAGGRRLEGDLLPWLPSLQSAVKHKCRIVWACKGVEKLPAGWAEKGELQKHPVTGYWTRPGLFSWDRIDPASAMLMTHIPATLAGTVADPGCGYGALTDHVLNHCPQVIKVHGYDADARAVAACRKNIAERHPGRDAAFEWCDFAAAENLLAVNHVIMNPPFHKDKVTAIGLGQGFIAQAARMLRPGGDLYMVANAHLPYEGMLRSLFSAAQTLEERNGFKIFYARR